jgi:hypothetical protein
MSGVLEPSRSQVIRWLKTNFAVTSFIFGLLGGAGMTIVTVTWAVSKFDTRVEKLESWHLGSEAKYNALLSLPDQVLDLHVRVTDLEHDRRERDERRRQLASDLEMIRGDIRVHASQLFYLGQAMHDITTKIPAVRAK